jgi:ATP-dependent helicase/nuclease subunit A
MTEEEREASRYVEREFEPLYPRFAMEEEEAMTGAARGTAYHRVMECLDYTKVGTAEELKFQVEALVKQEKLKTEEAASIRIRDLEVFAASPIGQRMKQAAKTGNLYREQPFVISEQASLLDPSWNGEEQVLVQGIIDAYFLENDEIVLVDYKTDRVHRGEEQKLIDLYHVQLEDYARALERMLLRKVKETYIYSFTLGKEIRLFL